MQNLGIGRSFYFSRGANSRGYKEVYAAAYTKCATAHTAGKKRMPMHTQSVPLHTLAQA